MIVSRYYFSIFSQIGIILLQAMHHFEKKKMKYGLLGISLPYINKIN